MLADVAVARRSSFDNNAICYVLSVLWMTSCFHIFQRMDQNQRRRDCLVHFQYAIQHDYQGHRVARFNRGGHPVESSGRMGVGI